MFRMLTNLPRLVARLAGLLIAIVLFAGPAPAVAAPAALSPPLGMADSFAILAATAITNVPTSAISGDVGLSPAAGSNYTGLGLTDMVTGTIYAVDATGPAGSIVDPALLTTAKTDLVTAFDALGSQACDVTYVGSQDLATLTLVPGVYCADDFVLSGVLTLDGAATDVWVFKSASTLITSGTASVILTSGVEPCEVWWQVGSSATLATNTSFGGNILALTSISLATNANLAGRALARNGAVTMDQNTITRPICSPTAVELLYFQAVRLSSQQVRLEWATALEVDNFGFNLYRANVNDLGQASLIHFEPADPQGSSGATYAYIDTTPYPGEWWYWLADVDTQGHEQVYLPSITVLVPSYPYRLYLPFLAR